MKKNILIIGVFIAFVLILTTGNTPEAYASIEVSKETAPCCVVSSDKDISVSKGEYKDEKRAKTKCEIKLSSEITSAFTDCFTLCTQYMCNADFQGPSSTCNTEETSKKCVKWGRGEIIDIIQISGGSRPVYEQVCLEWAPLYTGTGGGNAACKCEDIEV